MLHNPGSNDSWRGPYRINALPKDPWGKPYMYRGPGRHSGFDISSCGDDGVEGSVDDIVSWK